MTEPEQEPNVKRKVFDPDAHEQKYFTPEQTDEEPEETEYNYTYAFLCAEGTDPADQLDQDFYDINHNYARYGKLLPASICTTNDQIRTRLSEMEVHLKELLTFDPDTLSEDGFSSIGELEFCIHEFKLLLGIPSEREQNHIKQEVD